MSKNKNLILAMLICMVGVFFSTKVNAQTIDKDNFKENMKDYNIRISGNEIEMLYCDAISYIAFKTGIPEEECKIEDYASVKSDNMVAFSPYQIANLYYLALSDEDRPVFLEKVENQIIEIQQNNSMILISYTENISQRERASSRIYSTKSGTIEMQEKLTKQWGSADVSLSVYFTKTTSGSNWSLTVKKRNDCTVDENSSSPVQIVNTNVYWGDGYVYSSSNKYEGNEIKVYTMTDVSCGFQTGTLYVYVYPNSTYNYAKLG